MPNRRVSHRGVPPSPTEPGGAAARWVGTAWGGMHPYSVHSFGPRWHKVSGASEQQTMHSVPPSRIESRAEKAEQDDDQLPLTAFADD